MSDASVWTDPTSRRALELDALAAILPLNRRDQLVSLLTHLAREGMGENSLRALASDLAYLEGWCLASTGSPLPWSAPEDLALKFLAQHLWDPAERERDAQHGMPELVASQLRTSGLLRSFGPHAPSTVKRRLSNWATLHRWKGLEGPFGLPTFRAALKLAVRAGARPRRRKSQQAVTRNILDHLLATCATDRLVDVRDRAILSLAFASGGGGAGAR